MVKSRTSASVRNSIVSVGVQIITLLIMFIQRTFFIKYLATEYLGIDGLINNILSLLNMVELGFGSALVYSMYKPMAEGDENKLNLLMKLYAKIYNTIGIIVLVIGFSLTPFLKYFIKDIPNIQNLSLIFCMHVFNTGLSYFFTYKSSIITVAQNQYIVNINKFIFIVIQNIIQVIILVLFKNYIAYYSIAIICTFFTNLSISKISNIKYPFIKKKAKGKLNEGEIKDIKQYVSAMFINKLGWIILDGTDNLLISKYISVIIVGVYSNYLLIITALHGLIQRIFTSFTASVGNLGVTEKNEHSYKIFKKALLVTGILAGECSICLYILLNQFIYLWIGEKFILSSITVFIMVINFYLATIRRAAYTFDEAYGVLIHCKYKPIFEAITNLVISIILGKLIGINGILLGTVISTLLFTFWIEPYVLYKYVFDRKIKDYFISNLKYLIITIMAAIPCFIISKIFSEYTMINFIIKTITCVTIPLLIYYIFFRKTEEFKFFISIKSAIMTKIKK